MFFYCFGLILCCLSNALSIEHKSNFSLPSSWKWSTFSVSVLSVHHRKSKCKAGLTSHCDRSTPHCVDKSRRHKSFVKNTFIWIKFALHAGVLLSYVAYTQSFIKPWFVWNLIKTTHNTIKQNFLYLAMAYWVRCTTHHSMPSSLCWFQQIRGWRYILKWMLRSDWML